MPQNDFLCDVKICQASPDSMTDVNVTIRVNEDYSCEQGIEPLVNASF